VPTSARDARHSEANEPQLIHHRVDGFLSWRNFAAHVDGDLLRQIAIRDRESSPRQGCEPGLSDSTPSS